MQAVRLFQGYLWHPRGMAFDPALLPKEVEGAHLVLDEVPPPVAFFEDGTPTATQRFYKTGGVGAIMPRTSVRGYMDPHFCL